MGSRGDLLKHRYRLEHPLHLPIDRRGELRFHRVHVSKLGYRPSPELAVIVHRRYPILPHGVGLFFGIFTPTSFDLDHEMQRVIGTATVVHQHNEIGAIAV